MTVGRGSGLEADPSGAAAPARIASLPEVSDAGIEPAARDVVAFVGRTLKGPLNEPVEIGDFARFQQVFGGLWHGSLLPHALEQFFEHGGRHAVVVRVACGARPPSIDLAAGRDRLTLVGLTPGSGESLRASVDHDGISRQDPDLFNLVVQRVRLRGSELVEDQEIYRRVSILPGSARDVTRKLAASKLARVRGGLPAVRPDITRGADPAGLIGYVDCNGDGEDGEPLTDYDLIGSPSRGTGLFALERGPAFNFLYLPPPERGRDVGISALAVATRLCRAHNAMLLVDPPLAWRSAVLALEGLREWPLRSPDALMFFPRLAAPDRLTGRIEEFAPGAAAIGTLLRDDGQGPGADADPPLVRPGAQPTLALDRVQRARLAQLGVNVLRAARLPLRERIAPRTLAGPGNGPQNTRLDARRLALQLAASIERGTKWVTLEGNTPRSRERVCRQVAQLLGAFASHGAFGGAVRDRDWFVLCDERLNGQRELAAGRFRLVWGYQARESVRLAWLVEHEAGGSVSRPVSLNHLAALG